MEEMEEEQVIAVIVSCPDAGVGQLIASTLVQENLAACVNLLPVVQSTYRWEGQIRTDAETLLMVKSTRSRLSALCQCVQAMHPHELPEIIALPVSGGSDRYLDWVRQSVVPA